LMLSTTLLCLSSDALSCSTAIFRSVISRKTRTTPIIFPLSSLIGAPLSSTGLFVPSLAINSVWFASPTITPSLSTFATGSSACLPVFSFITLKTSFRGLPIASSCFQPVKASATGFINVINLLTLVAIKASPILLSVVASHCSLSFNFLCVVCL